MRANHLRTIVSILLLASFCAGSSAQVPPIGAQNSNGPGVGQIALGSLLPASLPYRLNQGMITVKVSVSDGIPQDAVIATGLPLTVITPELATKQTLKPGNVLDMQTLLGPVKATSLASQSIHLGRLLLSGVPVAMFDLIGHLSSK